MFTKRQTRMAVLWLVALALPVGLWAAPYSKHVQGDTGGFPAGAPNSSDIGIISDQVKTGATVIQTPGMDTGGFPANTYNNGDLGNWTNALKTGGTMSVPLQVGTGGGTFPYALITATSADTGLAPGTDVTISGTLRTGDKGTTVGNNFSGSNRGNMTFPIQITGGTCTVTGAAGTNVVACTTPMTGNCLTPVYGANGVSAYHTSSFTLTANCTVNAVVRVRAPACSVNNYQVTAGAAATKYLNCNSGDFGKDYTFNGIVEICGNSFTGVGEQCDDGNTNNGDCCSSTCQYEASGSTCAAAAGACDNADTCNATGVCVNNGVKANGTVCRTGSGDSCDANETCDGVGVNCPVDVIQPVGTLCRAGSGDTCDPNETCTGAAGAACPVDVVQPSGTVCRVAAVQCDVAETCGGTPGVGCPADGRQPDGTACTDCGSGSCTTCLSGVCQDASYVIDLVAGATVAGEADVDVTINTGLPEVTAFGNNLGGYDVTITYDSTKASFSCPSGLSQLAPAFSEPLLNQCALDLAIPTAAKIRIADVNTNKTATAGSVTVKRLHFTNITAPQGLTVQLTNNDNGNLIDYDANTVACGMSACSANGAPLNP